MAPTENTAAEAAPPEEKTETKTEEVKNPLEMSDEEFLKIPPPNTPPVETAAEEKTEGPEKADNDSKPPAETKAEDEKGEEGEDGKAEKAPKEPPKAADTEPGKEGKDAKPAGDAKPEPEKADDKGEPEKPVNYEEFFRQVMTPFKANGKTFEVKSPEEAIRLMQKGAGYGRKLQDMQPHLKVLRMLEKNNLLDEDKLSFLIDINQKKPEAIKKLIKDGGIDPLDLNPDDKVTYTPTNHAVSDKEVAFHQAIGEVQTQPGGHATLQHINQTWDEESKGLLWEEPEIFGVIQTQRENGLYDQILAEIDRQKLLGHIKNSTPFLQAYKVAGDHLVKTNGFKAPVQTQQEAAKPPAQVIATRTATPKPQAQNGDKVAAAAPTKVSTATKPTLTVNPLQMSDDDFMKQFSGRF